MKLKLSEIAKLVDGKIDGDGEVIIEGVAGLREATNKDVSFLANPK